MTALRVLPGYEDKARGLLKLPALAALGGVYDEKSGVIKFSKKQMTEERQAALTEVLKQPAYCGIETGANQGKVL